jgi:hypothetical protein
VSIERTSTGKYRVRYRQGGASKSKSFDRMADARLYEAEMTRRRQSNGLIVESPRLRDYMKTYWDGHVKKLSDGSKLTYGYARKRVEVELGGFRLNEIRPGHVQGLVTKLQRRKVGEASILKVTTLLSGMFRQALVEGLRREQPRPARAQALATP